MKSISILTVLFFLSISLLNAQTSEKKEVPITKGKEISDSLSSESIHTYTIKLDSSYFVYGIVNQKTVDVVVNIYNEEKKKVASFDGPAKGPENFLLETKSKGNFQIEVVPFEEKQGSYSIVISTVEPLATQPAARVKQYMTPYTGKTVPGAAVAVVKDDKIIFEEAYGMANLTYNIPFNVSTPTNIGSTSKQFTAFAILLLEDKGLLSLDDDIRKYFPEIPDFKQKVTIRHLLTHTSGYREFLNTLAMTGRDLSSPLDSEMLLRILQNQPELQNEPGAEWNYNNTGFALMAQLVEKITDVPFPEWMKENVFNPLNMNNTLVRADQNQLVPGRSQGYNFSERGEYQEVNDLGGAMGAGGMYSTLEDLVKWVVNLGDPKVGNKKIIEQMTTPFILNDGDTTNYGLGLFIDDYKGLKQIHHGGADVAHRSMLMYFPEIDGAVITQSNFSGFAGNSAQKIADTFFETHIEKEKEKSTSGATAEGEIANFDYEVEKFDPLTGRYELEVAPGFILTFKREGDKITGTGTGQPEFELIPVSDSVFKILEVDVRVTFHMEKDGSVKTLTLHQNGDHLAKRITWDPKPEELSEFPGNYYSKEIQTMFVISLKEENLVLENYQIAKDIELTPTDTDSFSAGFPIADITFARDEQGKITGLRASNVRARGIFFERTSD